MAEQRRVLDRNFGLEEFKYRIWSVDLEEDQTVEHVLTPRFFASVAGKIAGQDPANPKGIGDIIRVRKRDSSGYWSFLIVAIGQSFIKLHPIEKCEPPQPEMPADIPFATRWNPGKKSFEVIRTADKVMTAAGFQTKADAHAWIAEHMKAMVA